MNWFAVVMAITGVAINAADKYIKTLKLDKRSEEMQDLVRESNTMKMKQSEMNLAFKQDQLAKTRRKQTALMNALLVGRGFAADPFRVGTRIATEAGAAETRLKESSDLSRDIDKNTAAQLELQYKPIDNGLTSTLASATAGALNIGATAAFKSDFNPFGTTSTDEGTGITSFLDEKFNQNNMDIG